VDSHSGVLVVDDDASIRLLCRVNLELDGIPVDEAGSLGEARSLLSERPFDIVLLDVHVGTESGAELLEELRRDRPDVKVALLTGSEGADVGPLAADAVIRKPFTLDELRDTVRGLAPDR
jgi:DNA-binding response OmpR family regulator